MLVPQVASESDESKVEYDAWSYIWGDTPIRYTIICNSQSRRITLNLLTAFQHLRLPIAQETSGRMLSVSTRKTTRRRVSRFTGCGWSSRMRKRWLRGLVGRLKQVGMQWLCCRTLSPDLSQPRPRVFEDTRLYPDRCY